MKLERFAKYKQMPGQNQVDLEGWKQDMEIFYRQFRLMLSAEYYE